MIGVSNINLFSAQNLQCGQNINKQKIIYTYYQLQWYKSNFSYVSTLLTFSTNLHKRFIKQKLLLTNTVTMPS